MHQMRESAIPFILLIVIFNFTSYSQISDIDGYAIVNSDTIYGKVDINFNSGYIMVKQDSINRIFVSDVQKVVLLNNARDKYVTWEKDGKINFFKLLVDGKVPLLENEDNLCIVKDNKVVRIENEKDIYDILKEDKKELKNYVFVRNISIEEKQGVIEVFRYYNKSIAP